MKIGNLITTSLLIIVLSEESFGQGMIVKAGTESKALIRMTASFADNQESPDYSVVYFDSTATNEFDGQLDALKILNTDLAVPNLFILTPSDVKVTIKALPYIADTLYTIPVGLKTGRDGDVIIKLQNIEGIFSEMKISITDKFTGIEQDLLDYHEYRIALDAGEYSDRFFLSLSNKITVIPDIPEIPEVIPDLPEVVTAIPETDLPDNFTIYFANDILKAEISDLSGREGILRLFNLSGQLLFSQKIYNEGHYEYVKQMRSGVYLASFNSGNITTTRKIFIKNR